MRCDKKQIKLSGWQQELDADIARIGFKVNANFPCFSYSNQNTPSITCCE